ncbi:hypothetical protein Tcan_04706 [Toxocara canis]|uniref:Uncharacterized protein n=1 Tax=Toxocara canis TaxID=6265 RepID=A0A0B2VDI2_TOXCA|nr:hypothetical protein Tcan_04706 [Toxocara canis]
MRSKNWKWRTALLILYALCISATLVVVLLQRSGGFSSPKSDDNSTTNVAVQSNNKKVRRKNMEQCAPIYGKITIFIAVEAVAFSSLYKVALSTVKCYAASTNYDLKIVDVFNDKRVAKSCIHKSIYFRKHCAVAAYLNETDWMMVMDADTGVVNPNHCIEEYIDERVNMVFYERFFNWEIMSGNYLAKNSEFTRDFLMRWADYEFLEIGNGWWKGFDNGALHGAFLETIYPRSTQEYKNCQAIWFQSKGYDTYMPFVACVRIYLGAVRLWPGKLRLLRRAHGMARDWYHTGDAWCEVDFMIHGWKANKIGENGWQSPFTAVPDPSKCGAHYDGWSWRPEKRVSVSTIREMLQQAERSSADAVPKKYMTIPFYSQPDIANCYPECEKGSSAV